MNDDADADADELDELRREQQALAARMDALTKRLDNVLEAAIGDREVTEDAIEDGPDLWTQLDDLQSAVADHGDRLEAIANVGGERTSKDEKILSIAAFATKKADGPHAKILVTPDEICGCTGVSRRYAYELVDTIGDDESIEWASVRQPGDVPTGNGPAHKTKGLKIEYGSLRESSYHDEVVNQFNTGSPEVSG